MFELFLALFLACTCPAQNHNCHNQGGSGTVTTLDVGGDTGHLPPPPPPPGS